MVFYLASRFAGQGGMLLEMGQIAGECDMEPCDKSHRQMVRLEEETLFVPQYNK